MSYKTRQVSMCVFDTNIGSFLLHRFYFTQSRKEDAKPQRELSLRLCVFFAALREIKFWIKIIILFL
jgi:hypothetical protein